MQPLLRGPRLSLSACPESPSLGGGCQYCLALVNAVRCDLITATYLGVSTGLLARHKIDPHQGQALRAAQAKQELHFEEQSPTNTGVGTQHVYKKAPKTQLVMGQVKWLRISGFHMREKVLNYFSTQSHCSLLLWIRCC